MENKKVLYTCITGGYDDIPCHLHVEKNWDYILFTDDEKLIKKGKIYHWNIKPLAYQESTNVKNARWHKINAHILFPDYKYSVWVDGNISVQNNTPFKLFNKLIKQSVLISIPLHQDRNCIYKEAKKIKDVFIDYPKVVNNEVKYIKKAKYPKQNGLSETNIIFREHNNKDIKKSQNDWWAMVFTFSKRDQLSCNFVFWKNQIEIIPMYDTPGYHRNCEEYTFNKSTKHNQDKIKNKKKKMKIFKKIEKAIKKIFNKYSLFYKYKKIYGVSLSKIDKKLKNFNTIGVRKKNNTQKIVVSLTSFPQRMKDIHYAIYSLLNQSYKPDMVILWLGEDKFANKEKDLPQSLLKLKNNGLTIKWCKDLRSYTKLIPAMKEFSDDVIVTADDDIFYKKNWLKKLVKAYKNNKQFIHCHRVHKVLIEGKKIKPYSQWQHNTKNKKPSFLNFLTGVGGVLYPPHSLDKEVFNEKAFTKLSPYADDVWFWAMALKKNTEINIIDNPLSLIYVNPQRELRETGEFTLATLNNGESKNDEQIRKVLTHYKLYKKIGATS